MVIDIFMTITTFLLKLIFVDDIFHEMSLKNLDSVTLKINVCTHLRWNFACQIVSQLNLKILYNGYYPWALRTALPIDKHLIMDRQSEWKKKPYTFFIFMCVCVWWVIAYSVTFHARTLSVIIRLLRRIPILGHCCI